MRLIPHREITCAQHCNQPGGHGSQAHGATRNRSLRVFAPCEAMVLLIGEQNAPSIGDSQFSCLSYANNGTVVGGGEEIKARLRRGPKVWPSLRLLDRVKLAAVTEMSRDFPPQTPDTPLFMPARGNIFLDYLSIQLMRVSGIW